jgi:hypothetical protein
MLYNIQQLNVWAFKAFLIWWLLDQGCELPFTPASQLSYFSSCWPYPSLTILEPTPLDPTHTYVAKFEQAEDKHQHNEILLGRMH